MVDTLRSVIEFIAQYRHEHPSQIQRSTRLREDLGLDGDDGEEFLGAYGARFHVDLAGFEFRRYFRDEANLLSPFLVLLEGWRRGRWQTRPITAAHLAAVADAGRWFDP